MMLRAARLPVLRGASPVSYEDRRLVGSLTDAPAGVVSNPVSAHARSCRGMAGRDASVRIARRCVGRFRVRRHVQRFAAPYVVGGGAGRLRAVWPLRHDWPAQFALSARFGWCGGGKREGGRRNLGRGCGGFRRSALRGGLGRTLLRHRREQRRRRENRRVGRRGGRRLRTGGAGKAGRHDAEERRKRRSAVHDESYGVTCGKEGGAASQCEPRRQA